MAAIDTFEWFIRQVWPNPDESTKRFIAGQRDLLLKIRNENERLRFIEHLMHEVKEMKKKKSA